MKRRRHQQSTYTLRDPHGLVLLAGAADADPGLARAAARLLCRAQPRIYHRPLGGDVDAVLRTCQEIVSYPSYVTLFAEFSARAQA